MMLLSFGREHKNFMARKRAEEQHIYFRDVYIIHLARRERENMIEMQKPEEKK